MQLNALIQVAIFLASQAVAAPLVDPADVPAAAFPAADLLKRANPSPVSCGRKLKLRVFEHDRVKRTGSNHLVQLQATNVPGRLSLFRTRIPPSRRMAICQNLQDVCLLANYLLYEPLH